MTGQRWFGVLVHEREVDRRGAAGASSELLTLVDVANACELHPDQVRAFMHVGVIDAATRRGGQLLFPPQTVARLSRAVRLRQDLGIGVHALGLVLDLLERVDALEAELQRRERQRGTGGPW